MPYIHVKNYEHINRSFPGWDTPKGKYIRSKEHYEQEMAKNNMISYEKAQQMAEKNSHKSEYKGVSEKTMKFLHQVKDMADKKGNIKISDRFVQGLKEHGVNIDAVKNLPKNFDKGGFSNG